MHIKGKLHEFWARLPLNYCFEKIEEFRAKKMQLNLSGSTPIHLIFWNFFRKKYTPYIKKQREHYKRSPKAQYIS